MPDDPNTPVLQQAMQPLLKLTQANMELLTQFAMSPEVMSQSLVDARELLHQSQQSTAELLQSGAFAQLMQGVMKNYSEFVQEVGQGGMAAVALGQAEIARRVQQAGAAAAEAAPAVPARRHR